MRSEINIFSRAILLLKSPAIGIIMLALIGVSPVLSQNFYYTFDNTAGTASYLLGSVVVPEASYSTHSMTLSRELSDRIRFYLDANHLQVYPHSDYSSTTAETGLQFRYLDVSNNQFFAGVYGYLYHYEPLFDYYNSLGLGYYLKWKYYFKPGQLLTAGIDTDLKQYSGIDEASHTERELYVMYNQSFPSRTSLNFQTSFAYQDFWPQSIQEGFNSIEVDEIATNYLFLAQLRLAQSLGDRIGLTLWFEDQKILTEAVNTLEIQDGMSNPFIDRFRWEGPSSALRLQGKLSGRQTMTLSHQYAQKQYDNVPVYDYDFEAMNYVIEDDDYVDVGYDRRDRRQSLSLSWSLRNSVYTMAWLTDWDVVISGGWTRNSSNDPLYDYESKSMSLGIKLNN